MSQPDEPTTHEFPPLGSADERALSVAPERLEPSPPAARPMRTIASLVLLSIVFFIGVAVGSTGALGGASSGPPQPAASGAPGASDAPAASPGELSDFDLFWQALDIIRQNYVGRDDLNDQQLTYGAIRGMVEALGDTGHSVFLTPEQVAAERSSLDGSIVGIGVLLGQRDGHNIVVSVVPDGPAQAAGIKAGDEIVAVDGEQTSALQPDELAAKIRGQEGTSVTVSVVRPSTGENLDFTIAREKIRIPAVSWTMVPGTQIGLLRLSQFSAGSAEELRQARDEAIAAGATSLILDLRGNPGGYVDQAVQATSEFISDKTVYIRELADGERIPVSSDPNVQATDLPLVILIDENSASSAEITAGALKSAGRGSLIGQTTFGTGTVLLPFDLADGSSIRLAIERWLTPNGDLIFGKGITPTEEVALGPDDVPIEPDDLKDVPADQVNAISDSQLLRAIQELLGQAPSPSPAP